MPEARSVIWELYKGADRLTCELRNHGNHGVEIVLLRNNAADALVQNGEGVSPLGLARRISNYDVAKFFGDLHN